MAEVKTTETFNCSVKSFFDIIMDYESYPEFIHEIQSCKILKKDGSSQLVEFGISIIKDFSYQLWVNSEVSESETKVLWELASGNLFKRHTGHWLLSPKAGKTFAEYYLNIEFTLFIPKMVTTNLIKINLPNMMSSFKKRVDELKKH